MPDESTERPTGLKYLDRLVGTWTMSGETQGEIIGYHHPVEADGPASTLTSRLYTNTGNTLDYTHEIDDEAVSSWYGEKGSSWFMKARWNPDGTTLTGAWEWPGGGYSFTLTRS